MVNTRPRSRADVLHKSAAGRSAVISIHVVGTNGITMLASCVVACASTVWFLVAVFASVCVWRIMTELPGPLALCPAPCEVDGFNTIRVPVHAKIAATSVFQWNRCLNAVNDVSMNA